METPLWLKNLLSDPHITDIFIHDHRSIFIDRGEGIESLSHLSKNLESWGAENLKLWVLAQISEVGKSWDARYPFIDARLLSGHRLHVVFPPISQSGILLSLRTLPHSTAEKKRIWCPESFYELLHTIVQKKETLVISGATGSGKTTLLGDLLQSLPSTERILALEDTPELRLAHPQFLSLCTRPPNAEGSGEITLADLLKQALRMRPDRILLGECRGSEVLFLLQALNTGHRGTLCTLHANSARDALRRIELLCLLASSGNITLSPLRELISVGIQWIAHLEREGSHRFIREVVHIEGREGDTILLRPMLKQAHEANGPSISSVSRNPDPLLPELGLDHFFPPSFPAQGDHRQQCDT